MSNNEPHCRLFDERGNATSPKTIQRGDRIEIRGAYGRSTIVEVDDIDDGPGGSFSMTVTEVCAECHHQHTPDGCVGKPSPSDIWAGVSVSACDCDAGVTL
jgi:hypothetical protein